MGARRRSEEGPELSASPSANQGSYLTIALTFDFDALAIWLSSMGTRTRGALSRGEFGARVGVDRVLRMLGESEIPATWFVPGHTIETFPEVCTRIVEAGHEIQHHGYAHEPLEGLTESEERRLLERGIEAIESITGKQPVGYRSPSWSLNAWTPTLLTAYGFEYDSSLMAHDFRLYWLREDSDETIHAQGPFQFGQRTSIVEVPVSWSLDDFPPFTFVWDPPRPGYGSTLDISRDWLAHFRFALDHEPNGILTITMHPQVVGRAHVLEMVSEIIGTISQHEGVEFETVTQAVGRAKSDGTVLSLS